MAVFDLKRLHGSQLLCTCRPRCFLCLIIMIIIILIRVHRHHMDLSNILERSAPLTSPGGATLGTRHSRVPAVVADFVPPGTATDMLKLWDEFTKGMVQELRELLAQHVKRDDPRLLALIRRYTFPPAKGLRKLSYAIGPPPQAKVAMELFKNWQKTGFFVECGSQDGERSSNTLHLEKKGWTGVLIEADPYYFMQSVAKKRKSWRLNGCLSPTGEPAVMNFRESTGGHGKLMAHGTPTACFPLYSVLLALNRSKVDFLSLDVEGHEMEILSSIPYDKLEITAITMEYLHNKATCEEIERFMVSKGFRLHKKIDKTNVGVSLYTHDLFFVKASI